MLTIHRELDHSFPGDLDHYPTRDEVVAYLADYARHFALPIEYDSRVNALRSVDDGYLVELDDRTYRADQVVVATGPFQSPRVPPIADELGPDVVQMHSRSYRTPTDIPAGPVLVVGGGNTGYQIAEQLAETHEVHLSIGSRQMPLPQRVLGRDIFSFLIATRLMRKTVGSRIGRRMKDRDSLIGSHAARRATPGHRPHGRTVGVEGAAVTFEGASLVVKTVIWATGFRLDHAWIDAPIFDSGGAVFHERGVATSPGLYFLGLPWQHTRGSALLGWVKDDARHIATRIETMAGRRPADTTAPLAA